MNIDLDLTKRKQRTKINQDYSSWEEVFFVFKWFSYSRKY